MKRVLSTFFVVVMAVLFGLVQHANADERRIDNVVDIWLHVRPLADREPDISVTVEVSVPNSTERQLVHLTGIGAVMKIYADVPANKPMWISEEYEDSSWNGRHWHKVELHIHPETRLDVGGSYSYGSGASAGTTPATHQLKK